ncbi:hypothetical protein [Flavobacterium granuli]|uniref:Sigma-70, region 4 n=1 Tax=Flavobacterium granuli TaxID=280093 RepID=A0ABU1S5Y5_9FLAO|nr:hypothetical protein [Flavobacterium granuli]MDR6845539.1 hypothetical protein [Flavobacterium granuli]
MRFRIGPFTFGDGGTRLSLWSGGTGFSVPIFNRNATSFGKIKLGIFSFLFNSKSKSRSLKKSDYSKINIIKKTHTQAYEPWSSEADEKLILLFRQGKTVKDLSEIFGRTNGAIRSRINKLLLK